MDKAWHDPLIGTLLDGRYRVEQRIATGGMSTVYKGTDTRLDRVLALKVMHPDLAGDEGFTARFIREAKAVARLAHPNVVNVFDQGADHGQVFLAMEYVPGRTLRDLLRDRGALSIRAALDIMEPVLAALGAAHRAGLVHRDVKPENVLITDGGLVKVADFGLVRVLGTADGAPTSTTTATGGTVMGTVSYLAPEQILPDAPTDQRVDVYAAGILLYEMLTGTRPHTGDNPVQVMYKHLHEDVPAPSRTVRTVPPALDAIVLGACARTPDARPYDAVELLATLQRVRRELGPAELDAEPPTSTRPSPRYPTSEPTSVIQRTPEAPAPRQLPLPLPQPVEPPAPERTSVLDVPPELMDQLLVEPRPYDEPTPVRPPRPNPLRRVPRKPVIWASALTVLVLLVGGVTYGLSESLYGPVPGVLGKDRAEAQRILDKEGMHGRFVDAYSETVPSGQVISTDPGVGARARKSDAVTVTVSKGPHRIAVPDVTGKPADQAASVLTGAQLAKGSVTGTYNDSVPEGSVISSSPAAGQQVAENTPVSLVVSKGMVPVPDVTGMTKDAAEKALAAAGFTMQATGVNLFGSGKASSQFPAAGERRPQHTAVTVNFPFI
ncbi:Stk1 family PASTA domain-containing Ser/Thr kinase [Streptomyces sp. SP17BM10]|uniref:Stk1 family PASTA domain-containing Ser/Thr kinase n=1 Tax=Streptomyces sp. SP17BM10 TaxID=3002530 RepID=UPI002E7A7C89|nr:Stk1 family PASTA domain-containing Ser/Thr kinase [Streptomyces sp. SP17BM10]MEE1785140.1 Stk1 family PASTA domain-containing Ser/Thr kinase [Streptomyces sp. SP17BM10]